jgi:hypothetical protein
MCSELSDNEDDFTPIIPGEDIEDLDPSLQALLSESSNEPTSAHQPQKISIKLQYVHNFTNVSNRVQEVITKLLKPIKIIIMDVSSITISCFTRIYADIIICVCID